MLLTGAASSLIMPSLALGGYIARRIESSARELPYLTPTTPASELTGRRRFATRPVASCRMGERCKKSVTEFLINSFVVEPAHRNTLAIDRPANSILLNGAP